MSLCLNWLLRFICVAALVLDVVFILSLCSFGLYVYSILGLNMPIRLVHFFNTGLGACAPCIRLVYWTGVL